MDPQLTSGEVNGTQPSSFLPCGPDPPPPRTSWTRSFSYSRRGLASSCLLASPPPCPHPVIPPPVRTATDAGSSLPLERGASAHKPTSRKEQSTSRVMKEITGQKRPLEGAHPRGRPTRDCPALWLWPSHPTTIHPTRVTCFHTSDKPGQDLGPGPGPGATARDMESSRRLSSAPVCSGLCPTFSSRGLI